MARYTLFRTALSPALNFGSASPAPQLLWFTPPAPRPSVSQASEATWRRMRPQSSQPFCRGIGYTTYLSMVSPSRGWSLPTVHAARLRKALRVAHQSQDSPLTSLVQPSVPAALMPQPSPSSWMEHLPPKLSSETVQDLVAAFKANYPEELLDDDSMPSIRYSAWCSTASSRERSCDGFLGSSASLPSSIPKLWRPSPPSQ